MAGGDARVAADGGGNELGDGLLERVCAPSIQESVHLIAERPDEAAVPERVQREVDLVVVKLLQGCLTSLMSLG